MTNKENKILLVEDSPVTVKLISKLLKKSDYVNHELVHADTLQKAVDILTEKNNFELILLDLGLPDSYGIETFYKVKEVSGNAAIVVESGDNDEEIAVKTIQDGAQDYLLKNNINSDILLRTIRYAIERKNKEDELNQRILFKQTVTGISSYLISLGTDEIDIGITRTLQSIADFSNVDRCHFISFTDELEVVDVFEYGREGVALRLKEASLEGKGVSHSWFLGMIGNFEEIIYPTISDLPAEADADRKDMEAGNVKSIITVPMIDKENIKACIGFETTTCEREWSEDDVSVLRIVGEIILNFMTSKLLEKSKEENEKILKNILNSMQTGVLVIDSQKNEIVNVNRSAVTVIGGTDDEIMGKDIDTVIPPNKKAEDSQAQNYESEMVKLDGKKVPVLMSKAEILIDGKTHEIVSFSDITDRKAAEYELAQDQKLKSIGSLAAGIAHEINTPTQYVSDNTRFLQDAFEDMTSLMQKYQAFCGSLKEKEEYQEPLEEIDELIDEIDVEYLDEEIPKSIEQSLSGLDRISTIVNAMRDYSHPEMKEKKASDINKIINNSITVGRSEWKYHADMITELDEELPPVNCHNGEVSQVILNMVINAAHAIEESKAETGVDKGEIRIATKQVDDDWVEITISDNGAGVPDSVKDRIFDPFFTTKDVGKGTGQGLALVHKVVIDKHSGTLTLESERGKGTTFFIRLPINGGEELGECENEELVDAGKE